MGRVVLIANPLSTHVTEERIDTVARALRARLDVVVRRTERPGHAGELARQARDEGAGALVVFSGDGTYNEAVNGIDGDLPMGFVPGGGASVLPRALGLSRDPVRAAVRIADAIVHERTRTIGLGLVNGRRFTFSAGIGLDAELVRRVDRRGRAADGRRPGNGAFVTAALSFLAGDGLPLEPQLEVEGHGRAASVFVGNGGPYTYLGPLPLRMSAAAEFGEGIDFVALRRLKARTLPRLVLRLFRGVERSDGEVLTAHDLDRLDVRCDRPLPLQADGEDLGDVTGATFAAERDALRVFV